MSSIEFHVCMSKLGRQNQLRLEGSDLAPAKLQLESLIEIGFVLLHQPGCIRLPVVVVQFFSLNRHSRHYLNREYPSGIIVPSI